MNRILHALIGLFAFSVALIARADFNTELHDIQERWASCNYQLQDKAQIAAFESLHTDSEALVQRYPDQAAAWIWSGIIKSSFAGAKGGLGALSLAKAARADLEKALSIDPTALQGSAYTSLGTLYFKVPGWPLGFGDEDKAEELLKKALIINPDGIDPNYFYAQFLIEEKHQYPDAKVFLEKARQAAPRPDRQSADAGRQQEIALALATVEKKLQR